MKVPVEVLPARVVPPHCQMKVPVEGVLPDLAKMLFSESPAEVLHDSPVEMQMVQIVYPISPAEGLSDSLPKYQML
jgi:hypothetical protein